MRALKVVLVVATVGGAALVAGAGAVSAMPIGGLTVASSELAGHVQNVRCGRHRCGWRPRVYSYPPVVHAYPSVYYSPYYPYYGSPYYRPYWDWWPGWLMGRGI
jgi:hypothetical protein